jgi:isopenicillin-N epimerase
MEAGLTESSLNFSRVQQEFPRIPDAIYLNTGSNGRKPQSVLAAIADGWQRLNENPTIMTFLDPEIFARARRAAAALFDVPPGSLLLTQSTTQGLQLIMQSFLLKPGDEFLTTTHEHGSLYAVARFLEESRGIVTRRYACDPFEGSDSLCLGLLEHVTHRTKLVAVSQISSMTGWHADLSALAESLALLDVPLLVDGAHAPGQVHTRPANFPLWVGSAHKWLGAPNASAFAYVAPHLVRHLEPVWLGDKYYERKELDVEDLTRFESNGTADVVKWLGVARAVELCMEFGQDNICARQIELVDYLRSRLTQAVNPTYRTPIEPDNFKTAMLTFHFPEDRVKVPDLKDALWERHRIWIQPDFFGKNPGLGARISCHYAVSESDLDVFVEALQTMIANG